MATHRSGDEPEYDVEEDGEEEEFIEEEEDVGDGEGERRNRVGCTASTGRTVTLQMLLAADILQPGEATMSIEYLGQKFMGDLLPDGKIKSLETDIIFASPSAWAIHCKRIINPEKKSGCGWASVKYKGRKLDVFKNAYFKKRTLNQNKENECTDEEEMDIKPPAPVPVVRIVVKHNVIGNRLTMHDPNTLVESTPFSALGKIQPFLVSMATNAALIMDFHCHLTTSEVVGYLAGHWDVNAHNLAITHAFPCRSRLSDQEMVPIVENEIKKTIRQRRLTLVGWYHSHPTAPATPSLRDIDAQLEYEIHMKGNSDANYTPCVGVICSPYNKDSISLESSVVSYWVIPPPENRPHEYGRPMLMSYSVMQDQYLSTDTLNEMKKCAEYYKGDQDIVKFSEKYRGHITYLDKLKTTLTSKFPRDQSDGNLWNYLSELVCPGSTGVTEPPTINLPPPTSTSLPITIPATPKASSLLSAEIANALFASGKFPSPASLMGLSAMFPPAPPTGMSILKPLVPHSPAKMMKMDGQFTMPDKNYTITSGHT